MGRLRGPNRPPPTPRFRRGRQHWRRGRPHFLQGEDAVHHRQDVSGNIRRISGLRNRVSRTLGASRIAPQGRYLVLKIPDLRFERRNQRTRLARRWDKSVALPRRRIRPTGSSRVGAILIHTSTHFH